MPDLQAQHVAELKAKLIKELSAEAWYQARLALRLATPKEHDDLAIEAIAKVFG